MTVTLIFLALLMGAVVWWLLRQSVNPGAALLELRLQRACCEAMPST